jgi:seryl-tRNA synthetase
MIHINLLRENAEAVALRLDKRGIDARASIQTILDLDATLRQNKQELEQVQARSNQLAKEIGQLFKDGKREEAEAAKTETSDLKEKTKVLENQLRDSQQNLDEALVVLPNMPHESVPFGKSAEDNETIFSWGDIPSLHPEAMPHWDLAKKYDLIDFELGVKITGAGFPVYKGAGARLQRALINFFLDEALMEGFQEVQPPIFVNEESGYGTGQLPDKEGQMYHMTIDNLYAIPTAEVPITNLYRDVIVESAHLPVKHVGYTPCFRREAGSYGKDVRGLNRLHQFDKVEIVQIAHPETSYLILEEMQSYVQKLLQKLELPYRVLRLCGGDMGFTSALTYDMEVYSAAQEKWLEVSSVSNFESFQSNRLKLRYRGEDGKIQLAHTLNGSALALPRIVAAILENNQYQGGIKMPAVLHPYLGFKEIGV